MEDDGGLASELAALSAVDLFTEEDMPTEEAMIGLEGYVVAGEDWVAKVRNRRHTHTYTDTHTLAVLGRHR